MQQYVWGGERYYYSNGRWLDSGYLTVPKELEIKLNDEFKGYVVKKKARKSVKLNTVKKNGSKYQDAMDHRIPGNFYRG